MQPIVLASSIIRASNTAPHLAARELERLYAVAPNGLRHPFRVLAALGGVVLYASVLVAAVR